MISTKYDALGANVYMFASLENFLLDAHVLLNFL